MPTIHRLDIVQLTGIVNQRQWKKTGDSSNACVCLYRSL